jgi:hypothetical protein
MIKPDAFANGYSGAILDMILKAGFRLIALKMTSLSSAKAGEFYAIHRARPFYNELVEFMSRGPIVAAILEKENAVADFRKLMELPTLQKLIQERYANYSLLLLEKMPSMAVTAMKMRAQKVIFSSQIWKESKDGSFSFIGDN